MESDPAQDKDAVVREAEAILRQASPALSAKVRELFEYLLETTRTGTPIKEFDIANQVFGRDAEFDPVQDASVRVYVHRLRRKLEEHYLRNPQARRRLMIPKGQYCLVLSDPDGVASAPAAPMAPVMRPRIVLWRRGAMVMAALALLALAVGLGIYLQRRAADRLGLRSVAETKLWDGVYVGRGTPLLVVGDYQLIGETEDGKLGGLTRRFDVTSQADLEKLVAASGGHGRYVNVGLRYLPLGAASAMRDVMPVMAVVSPTDRYAPIVPMSDLTPEMVKVSNLVYVGLLDGTGRLSHAIFSRSRLQVSPAHDELVDRKTRKRYDVAIGKDNLAAAHREFAYLARILGPGGNKIIVIAGTGDAGLIEAAAIARDMQSLRTIDESVGDGREFEALFQVAATGLVTYGVKPIFISRLDTRGAWQDQYP